MKEIYEERTVKQKVGVRVDLKESGSYYPIESICIKDGNVISFEHDSSTGRGGGYLSSKPEDPRFESYVFSFMRDLLKRDTEEFKKMREVLTGSWYDMAEEIRKSAISSYEF